MQVGPENVRFLPVLIFKCVDLQLIIHRKYWLLRFTEVIRQQRLEDAQTDTALQSTILEAHYYVIIFKDNIHSIWYSTANVTT